MIFKNSCRKKEKTAFHQSTGSRHRHNGYTMFNAEQLLGKLINDTLGSVGSPSGNSQSSKGILDTLSSSGGLMTAIGLGVGAFELLKEQQKRTPAGSKSSPPPPPGGASTSTPPPLPGGSTSSVPPVPPVPPIVTDNGEEQEPAREETALCMIRVMIAAAHADGVLDQDEEKAILDKLKDAGLSSEEKLFLLEELHTPRSISQLTAGITNPSTAKSMYMLAVSAIEIDTDAERQWLNELGDQLRLSPEIRAFIEEHLPG